MIGSNDPYVFTYQIIPVKDAFWISLADKENYSRCVGRTVKGKFIHPAILDQPCISDFIHICFKSQCNYIRLKTVCDLESLFSRASVRMSDLNVLACLFLKYFLNASL